MKRTMLIVGILLLFGMVGAVQGAGDAAAGKAKTASCSGCHGDNGEGTNSGPKLAGTPESQFVQAMQDFKSGKRSNAAMKRFAAKLSDDDMANIAAYYASLKGK